MFHESRATEFVRTNYSNYFWKLGSLLDDENANVCQGAREDSNGCRIDFIIRERNIHNETILLEVETGDTIQNEKCPRPPPLVEIIIGVASAMVLIGVFLLLLWKVVTHIRDKREYARFEKAINEASWETVQYYFSTKDIITNSLHGDHFPAFQYMLSFDHVITNKLYIHASFPIPTNRPEVAERQYSGDRIF